MKTLPLFALIAALLFTRAPALSAQTAPGSADAPEIPGAVLIDDFQRETPGFHVPPELTLSIAPAADGPAVLTVEWAEKHGAWMEFAYRTTPPLPEAVFPDSCAIAFDLYAEADTPLTHASIRLFDRGNETFQWQTRLPKPLKAGWQTILIPVRTDRPAAHWGGTNDGSVDLPLRLGGYAFVFNAPAAPAGHIRIRSVRILPYPSFGGLATDEFPNIVHAKAPRTCELTVTNPCPIALTGSFTGTLSDVRGASHPLSLSLSLAPGAEIRIPLPLPDVRPGVRYLRGSLTVAGFDTPVDTSFLISEPLPPPPENDPFTDIFFPPPKKEEIFFATTHHFPGRPEDLNPSFLDTLDSIALIPDKLVDALSRMFEPALTNAVPPGKSEDPFLYGICSHTERWPTAVRAREFAAAAAAGARVLRAGAYWQQIEPQPGRFDWSLQDDLVEQAAAHGLELQPILGFCPSHAARPETLEAYQEAVRKGARDAWKILLFGPPREDAWRAYVRAFATRYRGKIRLYEIWNEPDLDFWRGTTEQYIQLLRIAAEEIRAADPGARILTGGFATVFEHAGHARNPDLQMRVLKEAADAFDVHAHHQHGLYPEFEDACREIRSRILYGRIAEKPLYFNETAISSAHIGEMAQAVTLVKKIVKGRRTAIGYTWYDLRNDGTDGADMEHNYGLLRQDFSPKAAFAAYRECIRHLRGHGEISSISTEGTDGVNSFHQAPGSCVAVTWLEGDSAPVMPHLYRVERNTRVYKTDCQGVSERVPQEERLFLLTYSKEPTFWKLGRDFPQYATTLVDFQTPETVVGGEPVQLKVRVRNPLSKPMTMRLTARGPAGTNELHTLHLKARSSAACSLAFETPRPDADTYNLRLHYEAVGTPWKDTISAILPVTRILSKDPPSANGVFRTPDFTLASRANLHDFCAADPNLAAQAWRGPEDLSARAWLWSESEQGALYVHVVVQDDRHSQPYDTDNLWRGDSVQLCFDGPDRTDEKRYEIGAALRDDGTILQSFRETPSRGRIRPDSVDVSIERTGRETRYTFKLRFEGLGRLNIGGLYCHILVNDNDGTVRKCFMRNASGFGLSRYEKNTAPLLRFR